ncbi:DNA repair RAD52-like protein 2, chloroplastic [Andrographis paniculata]|uniref:DNA repair RAD52-like protein 2, chloroplastic n=1 Tax=Andrographis paniculata TaxID=175694 RepID=UPI0021E8B72F|nr:DNA repair RAD52-like protein 2, chloroplastic [Andrographis paniculata]
MAVQCPNFMVQAADASFPVARTSMPWQARIELSYGRRLELRIAAMAVGDGSRTRRMASITNTNYVVPLDKSSSFITRPLVEILRDLNKRIPDNIIKTSDDRPTFIPWYQANRMLSFYAPGWCGEIRDVTYSDNGTVTVVYRVTVRGSDGEAHRDSSGTVSTRDENILDPVAAAEELAFCRACARFGLGLYLYHEA